MCRNQSEVTAVLNDLGEDSETEPETESLGQAFEEGIPNLARLRLAVNYNQKRVSWALSPSLPRCPPNSKHLPCPAPPDASSCSQDLHSEHSCLGACWQEEKASAPPFRLHSPLPVPSPSEDPRTRVTQIPSFTLGQSAFELWLRPAE